MIGGCESEDFWIFAALAGAHTTPPATQTHHVMLRRPNPHIYESDHMWPPLAHMQSIKLLIATNRAIHDMKKSTATHAMVLSDNTQEQKYKLVNQGRC